MPKIESEGIAVIMDMAGCPNRCRHCWLGNPPNRRVPEERLRWVAGKFREWMSTGSSSRFLGPLTVMSWYREPDFAANYRELWELEKELSDEGAAQRFELLSIWRLARDEGYARWAREIGTQACQISLFGLEETTDYFAQRRGYFKDCLSATQRLLEAGIRPRWQLFLNQRLLPELDAFVSLIDTMQLEQRVRSLGQEFEVFLQPIAPDGEAFNIEDLRPTTEALTRIPGYLAEKTRDYHSVSSLEDCLGRAEKDWLPELFAEQRACAAVPDRLAFMVTPEMDVFSNIGEPMPWWKLGNLGAEGAETILRRFEEDSVPGLQANFHVPVSQLARTYGREDSNRLYTREGLMLRWLRLWGEESWRTRNGELVQGHTNGYPASF